MSTNDDNGLPPAQAQFKRPRGSDDLYARIAPWPLLRCAVALVGLIVARVASYGLIGRL